MNMEIATLRRTVEDMEYRLRALEEGVGDIAPLRKKGIPPSESLALACLMRRKSCSRSMLFAAIYGNRDDAPSNKILDVFICKLRKRLGLEIKNSRCSDNGGPETGGYYLTESDQAKLAEMLA